jgi:hypothetical protein
MAVTIGSSDETPTLQFHLMPTRSRMLMSQSNPEPSKAHEIEADEMHSAAEKLMEAVVKDGPVPRKLSAK